MSNFREANAVIDRTSFDSRLVFDDGNDYTSDSISQVASSDFKFDFLANLSKNRPNTTFNWNIDELESDSADETYSIIVEQSDTTGFTVVQQADAIEVPRATPATALSPLSISLNVDIVFQFVRVSYVLTGSFAGNGLSVTDGWITAGI